MHALLKKTIPQALLMGICIAGGVLTGVEAKEPSDLPGSEISDKDYFYFLTPPDSINKAVPAASPLSPTWIDKTAETWDAPKLSQQLVQDNQKLLMGMGAVFIPYMSSEPELEPEAEILDVKGDLVASGQPGKKYNLIPGKYYVLIGSGAHKQRIVKQVMVIEAQITPIIPDWAGLNIEVVDQTNQPFRGDYEIVRIDEFEPFGRGRGRDPNLGEKTKSWILKPGIYKIFGVGQNYNTFTNFVTVRLLPGEFIRFTLAEDTTDDKISGGGTVFTKATSKITSNWRYGINASTGIDFNYSHDKDKNEAPQNEFEISVLADLRVDYRKNAIEQNGRLRLDESFSVSNFDISQLANKTDELKLTSIFTWHLLPIVGPYGRIEVTTGLISQRVKRNADSLFVLKYKDGHVIVDSVSNYFRTQPAFSPVTFKAGSGVNVKFLNLLWLESQLLTGIGFTHEKYWNEWIIGSLGDITDTTTIMDIKRPKKVFLQKDGTRTEVGPEALLNILLRLGKNISMETEVEYFAPFVRIKEPDIDLNNTLSWRIARFLTLDYYFKYSLVQAKEQNLQKNKTSHRILIRFSFTRGG